jgi:hypothetical protein
VTGQLDEKGRERRQRGNLIAVTAQSIQMGGKGRAQFGEGVVTTIEKGNPVAEVGHPNETIFGTIEEPKSDRHLLGQSPQIVFLTGDVFEPLRKGGERFEEVLLTP